MTDLTAGLRDEVLTAAARDALRDLDDGLIHRSELEAPEAPDRLARHLAAVAQRVLRRLNDRAATAEDQARIINRAVTSSSPPARPMSETSSPCRPIS